MQFRSLVLGLLCCAAAASAQTADELVAKNLKAKGGVEKIKSIKSLRMIGKMDQGGFKLDVGQEAKLPDLLRETFTFQGMTGIEAYDGKIGWRISPFEGRKDAEMMGDDDLRPLVEDADFYGPLVDYQQKGNKVEYLGHDTVDGDDALRLKVTLKNGDILYYLLDPDTFLEIRTERQTFIRGSMRESVQELGSYKQVNGVYFPFSVDSGPKSNPNARARVTFDKTAVGSFENAALVAVVPEMNWRKVLAGANGSTGCGMMSSATSEPNTIYATMWDFQRKAWTFRSGGPGSAIFKSTDGGEHWTELAPSASNGMPEKPYGRIAIAVAPSKPNLVYAMIESKKSALYRSDDAGGTWKKLDASQYMVWRPFYFANLIVDPKNENKVFKVDGPLLLSVNGGKSFSTVSGGAHGDFHDVWIDPSNPNTVFTGDDGGLWISKDGGNRWEHLMNLPISQFYHVSVDNNDPYHVYGGLQDNSSWVGDSSYPGGVTNSRWENMYGGDGFWMWEDPADSNYIYAEAQGGEIGRVNRFTHESRSIKPYALYGEKKLRFNWNTPIQMSPNEKGTIYIGSQFLYRSRDHGQSWDRISPDLTTNDPEKQKQEESGGVTIDNSAAEMNTTIYSISESPKNGQIIWVGTDDGNVQITRDAGKTWSNTTSNVKGVGTAPWTSWVEASRYNEGTAYATFDRHMYGDMKPYLYKTTDYGATWTALPVQEQGIRGWAHVIKEDTVNPNLLFLGTEFGLWISIDGGQRWAQYKGANFPAVAVDDLVVHPRTADLVLATHGRGIWIIDDITPLRSLSADIMTREAAFLPAPPAVQYIQAGGGWAEGDATFFGPNRPGAAMIPYYQRSRHIFGDLKIEILDAQGKFVDTVPSSKRRGINRAQWSMRLKPPKVPPAASALGGASVGPRVLPGTYTVKMTKGDQTYTTQINVVLDPRAKYTVEDRRAQFELVNKLGGLLNHMSWLVDAIIAVRDGATQHAAKLPAGDPLRTRLTSLAEAADKMRGRIVATTEGGAITGEERLREFLGDVYGNVNGYDGRPNEEQVKRTDALGRELDDVVKEFNTLVSQQVNPANQQLAAKKLPPIHVISEADWQKANLGDGGAAGGAKPELSFVRLGR